MTNIVLYKKTESDLLKTETNPFRYAGEYMDLGGGNYYLRNRYYNPKIGRFLTEDPIRDGTNWYTYAINNPVLFMDPTGFKPGDAFKTERAAAKDFSDYICDDSINDGYEYGSYIYKYDVLEKIDGEKTNVTYYSYTNPHKGDKNNVDFEIQTNSDGSKSCVLIDLSQKLKK